VFVLERGKRTTGGRLLSSVLVKVQRGKKKAGGYRFLQGTDMLRLKGLNRSLLLGRGIRLELALMKKGTGVLPPVT